MGNGRELLNEPFASQCNINSRTGFWEGGQNAGTDLIQDTESEGHDKPLCWSLGEGSLKNGEHKSAWHLFADIL